MFEAPQTISLADLAQTHSWGETIAMPERNAAKAFCERCCGGGAYHGRGHTTVTYRVRGLNGIMREIKDAKGVECPKCGYTLFWSRTYTEVVGS